MMSHDTCWCRNMRIGGAMPRMEYPVMTLPTSAHIRRRSFILPAIVAACPRGDWRQTPAPTAAFVYFKATRLLAR